MNGGSQQRIAAAVGDGKDEEASGEEKHRENVQLATSLGGGCSQESEHDDTRGYGGDLEGIKQIVRCTPKSHTREEEGEDRDAEHQRNQADFEFKQRQQLLNADRDHDEVSCASTSIAKSRKTARRAAQREKKVSTPQSLPAMIDAMVQRELVSSHADAKIENLKKKKKKKKKLNESRLKLIAARGENLSLRRQLGEFTDEWPYSDINGEISSKLSLGGEEHSDVDENDTDESKADVDPTLDFQSGQDHSLDDDAYSSSFDDNVEVGDIAELFGLNSEQGKIVNGFYGKVVSFDAAKQRFGVVLEDGRSLSVRPGNLRMGMKEEELTSEDERLLLGLRPTSDDVRALPFKERVQASYDSTPTSSSMQ